MAKEDKEKQEKAKVLNATLSMLEKKFGKGAVMKLGSKEHVHVEAIPTGALTLDYALGVGGIPRGRVTEIYGPESGGKTTLTLSIIANSQKQGGTCAFIDAEHAMDPPYARMLGVDTDNLLISQPDTGEQGLEICEQLVRSGAVDLIVIDSVAALVPRAEVDGSMEDSQMGLHARLMSKALRKLTSVISKSSTSVIFINQVREKIGIMYGNPETTTGGRALKFYSSIRIELRRITDVKKGNENIGISVRAKVVKNKVAPPFKIAVFDILYGTGINKMGCIVDLAVQEGIIEKSGSWYSFEDEKLGQGKDNVVEALETSKELLKKVESKLKKALDLKISGGEIKEDKKK